MEEGKYILHVGCSADDNYIHHAAVMICSLLESNTSVRICIHLLFESLKEQNVEFLRNLAGRYGTEMVFHKVDAVKLEGVRFRKVRPLSSAAYYRLLLSSILTDVDKVLYLDVDTAVLGDISPLFRLDMDGYALAAVKDVVPCFDDHRMSLSIPYDKDYFCSAVMLINLEYWREHDAEARLIEFAKRDRIVYCHDQDALNYVFKGQWFALPPKWNRFHMDYIPSSEFRDYKDKFEYYHRPVIVHFSGYKPSYRCFGIRFEDVYEKYLELSGCQPVSIVKVPLSDRLAPVRTYLFRKALKKAGLYRPYLYMRLYLRHKLGRI